MAPQVKKHLSDIEIDEISLVDRGANQHARTVIAKRAPKEDTMPELYDEEGNLLPDDIELTEGDVVYDAEGQAYEFTQGEDENEYEEEPELVGKAFKPPTVAGMKARGGQAWDKTKQGAGTARSHISANRGAYGAGAGGLAVGGAGGYGMSQRQQKPFGKSFKDELMEELSKAYTDEERDQVIAKAFDQVEQYSQQAMEAEEIAKAERDLRLTREYISKAAEYNVPVDPNELGPVLYRMAESMDYDDCAVIHKALEASGAALFDEIGHIGGGDNADVMSQVQAYASEQIGKSADEADTISKVFDQNPDAYEQYLAEQRGY